MRKVEGVSFVYFKSSASIFRKFSNKLCGMMLAVLVLARMVNHLVFSICPTIVESLDQSKVARIKR